MICCQVSGAAVMPAASASCFGMAMTAGVRARLGCLSGMIRSAAVLAEGLGHQAPESGTHTSGAGPCVLVSQSPASEVTTSDGSFEVTLTDPHVPPTEGDV